MIYRSVTARRGEYRLSGPAEVVRLTWAQRQRRVLRVQTSAGRTVGIALEGGPGLRDGDLLGDPERDPVVVEAVAEPVLVVRPASREQAALAGHLIGNCHRPAWIRDDEIVVEREHVLAGLLRRAGLPVEEGERVLDESRYRVVGGGHLDHPHPHPHPPLHTPQPPAVSGRACPEEAWSRAGGRAAGNGEGAPCGR